jgi:hypothetical protein
MESCVSRFLARARAGGRPADGDARGLRTLLAPDGAQ